MMKVRLAARLVRALSVESRDDYHSPGYSCSHTIRNSDGRITIVVADDGHFNVIAGRPPDNIVVHALESRQMLAVAWFVFWRWWVRGTWCGLKTRLWGWGVGVLFTQDGKTRPRPRRDQSSPHARRPPR